MIPSHPTTRFKMENIIVPKHEKLSDAEVSSLLNLYGLESVDFLSKIKVTDKALSGLDPQVGEVIKVTRKGSFVQNTYYRVVVS